MTRRCRRTRFHPRQGMGPWMAWMGLVFGAAQAWSQIASWNGGNAMRRWDLAENWIPQTVPLDAAGVSYTVLIPDQSSISFLGDTVGSIGAMRLGSGSLLDITEDSALTVSGTTLLRGRIQADGPGSSFTALSDGVVTEGTPTFQARNGASIRLAASSLAWGRQDWSYASLLDAADPGSLIELTNLASLSVAQAEGQLLRSIRAIDGGLIDLSGLGVVSGPGWDDELEFVVATGGRIDLSRLQQVSGRVRFEVLTPGFETPRLQSAQDLVWSIGTNLTVTAPVLNGMTGGSIRVRDGARWEAPQMARMDGVGLDVQGTGAIIATNLSIFRNGDLLARPGLNLQFGPLTDIFSSRLAARDGGRLRVSAESYDTFPNWNVSPTLFYAAGAGSLLDLTTLKTMAAQGGDAWWGGMQYSVIAEDRGTIDLSGLTSIFGCRTDAYDANDWLVFHVRTGGELRVPNLKTLTRRTQWNLAVPEFVFPALESVDSSQFNLAEGVKMTMPEVRAVYACAFSWGFNSTLDAPKLTRFHDSFLEVAPGRTLNVPAFTDILASRFLVSGGRRFRVAATSYEAYQNWNWSPTLFQSTGTGSFLDLSTLTSITAYGGDGWWGGMEYSVIAENNGTIDLSGLTSVIGCRTDAYDANDWLVFHVRTGGNLQLPSLKTITRRTLWHLGVPEFVFPELKSIESSQFNLADGVRMEWPKVQSVDACSFSWGFNSMLDAPILTRFRGSFLEVAPGRTLNVPQFDDIYASRFLVSGGRKFSVAANAYEIYPNWNASLTLFQSTGAGSVLDLSKLKTVLAHGGDAWWAGIDYSVIAENNGTIDLSGLSTVFGCRFDAYDNNDWLSLITRTGGRTQLGDTAITRRTRVTAWGAGTRIDSGDFKLLWPSALSVTDRAVLSVGGDYSPETTDANAVVIEGGTLRMAGMRPQRLEVGGQDRGAGGAILRNFDMSRLVVGETNRASVVRLVDQVDNGRRGGGGSPEALYLMGLEGTGLQMLGGSRLVLGDINAYAWVDGAMQHLNALIPAGANSVRFGDGVIARRGGPRIVSQTPAAPVRPPLSSLEVEFDMPIADGSLGIEDVTLQGPSGTVAVSRVDKAGERRFRIEFAAVTASGTYSLRIGPGVDEAAGNLLGMDQNGDGASGDPTLDAYVSQVVVDGEAPRMVDAYAFQGGTRVGVTFDEPLAADAAADASAYRVDGETPTAAHVQEGARAVVLVVSPRLSEGLVVSMSGARDVLGNTAAREVQGVRLPWTSVDLGNPGSDPLEPGWAYTLDGDTLVVSASGNGLWDTWDRGHFLYEARTGDFDVRVRLADLVVTGHYTHAGVMARSSWEAQGPQLFAGAYRGWSLNHYGSVFRAAPWQGAQWWPGGEPAATLSFPNVWLRLRREADLFRTYRSVDGTNWVEYASILQSMPKTLLVGGGAAAQNNSPGASTRATFSSLGDLSPGFAAMPQPQSVASGATAMFGAVVRGQAPLSFQWYRDGQPLEGATAMSLELSTVQAAAVGDYRLVAWNAWGTNWSVIAPLTVDGVGVGGGLEADVSPAPRGDGAVTIQDWVRTGLLIAGLEAPANSSHFQRADCAPAPCGDGRLSIADWTLSGLYAAALVEPVPSACGPTGSVGGAWDHAPSRAGALAGDVTRSIWTKMDPALPGQPVVVRVMASWTGGENAAGFSLSFDPTAFRLESAEAGPGAADGHFLANTKQGAEGRVGFAISRDIGSAFTAATVELARVRLMPISAAAAIRVDFLDAPIPREVVDPLAGRLAVTFIGIAPASEAGPRLGMVRGSKDGLLQVRIDAPAGTRWLIEASHDLRAWALEAEVTADAAGVARDVPISTHSERYFRARRLP